jgi:hypothetical protein
MADTVLGQAQTRIDWTAHDDASGIDHYELQRRNGTGQWVTVASPTTNQAVLPEKIGVAHTFRVRAYDVAGNVGAWSTGVSYTPTLKQATWSKITYAGTWVTDSISGASGSGVRRTLKKDATATFSFAGRALQIIVVKGPGRSVARIAVDGIGTNVDLSAGSVTLQWIGFARSWSGAGTHTVQIKNTSNARLELDALVIYQ